VSACTLRELGRQPYQPIWQAMQDFTAARGPDTPDELWLVEHEPVYTVGLAGREEHYPRPQSGAADIPVVRIDRGGQITYHGPGQVVLYALVDLARRGIKVREMVCLLEQAAIDVLAAHGIAAQRRSGAPGVYVAGAKIAALGLKVKRQGCYHGLSLNVDMDDTGLAPFATIDPCGYPGLPVTSMKALGTPAAMQTIGGELARSMAQALQAHAFKPRTADACGMAAGAAMA
jgi:lipoyl(octanoyl) transferase